MMEQLRRGVLIISMLFCVEISYAQWGLHTTIFHLESPTKYPNLTFVFGLDVDPSERTGLALDFTYGLGDPFTFLEQDTYYSNSSVSYSLKHHVVGLTFRSQYFFTDNDRMAFYMGPYVGTRRSSYAILSTGFNSITGNINQMKINVTTMTFPVGLRFGFRNGLSGYCQDNYLSFGYAIGADNSALPSYLETKHELSKLFVQLGFSFGIGWD